MGRDHRVNGKNIFASAARAGNLLRRMVQTRRAKFREQRRLRVYHCPPELRKDGQRYAVNYVWERELYIAWNVTSPDAQGQFCFRLLARCAGGRGAESPAGRGEGGGAPRLGKKRRCMSFGRDAVDAFGCCDGGRNRRPRPMKELTKMDASLCLEKRPFRIIEKKANSAQNAGAPA